MSDFDEIGKKPDRFEEHDSKPKGVGLFFNDKERDLFSSWGREISEEILLESFLLYRVDLQKTRKHKLYGESKQKVYKPEIEILGRLNVEVIETKFYTPGGGITKKGLGMFSAHIYIEQLEELNLVIKKNENRLVLDFKLGDFIGFKGQFYEIIEDGYSQISNKFSWGGDRRFYISVKAKEVDEDVFKAR